MKILIVISCFLLIFITPKIYPAVWRQNLPVNSIVNSFVVNGNEIYSATKADGVFLSTNNGESWISVSNGLPSADVTSIAVNGNYLIAGVSGKGLYSSTDRGENWSAVSTALKFKYVLSLAVIGNTIYAGTTNGGFYSTTDNGINWSTINTGLPANDITCILISGTNIFAGTMGAGVFTTTNGGSSWTEINTGLTNKLILNLSGIGDRIYAGTQGDGLFYTTYNGTGWNQLSGLLRLEVYGLSLIDSSIYAGTNIGFFLSTNNGTNWGLLKTNLPLTNRIIRRTFINGGKLFAGASNGGLIQSIDFGKNWSWSSNGFSHNSKIKTIAVNGPNVYAGTDEKGKDDLVGMFSSSDYGVSWGLMKTGFSDSNKIPVKSILIDGSNLYSGTKGGVYKSTDKGSTWIVSDTSQPLRDIKCFEKIENRIIALGFGIFVSTEDGASWTKSNTPGSNNFISIVKVDSKFFAGTTVDGVYISTDNGSNWASCNTGIPSAKSITALASIGNNIFAGLETGDVYITTNFGSSWTLAGTASSKIMISSLIARGKYLYASTYGNGIFYSTDNGSTWSEVNTGLTNKYVICLAYSGNIIYAGTDGGGLFYGTDILDDVNQDNKEKENGISSENYPNPFCHSTTISYSLLQSSKVEINIFDLNGNLLRTLINKLHELGDYQIEWDGKDNQAKKVESGMYYYQIKANSKTTGKMMVFVN